MFFQKKKKKQICLFHVNMSSVPAPVRGVRPS
jgi:hypothetical protein